MPRNASTGVYTLPNPDYTPQTLVKSADMNTTLHDLGNALTDSISKSVTSPQTVISSLVISGQASAQASSPPTLDGHANAGAASVAVISATLTTTKPNDIVCVLAFAEGYSALAPTVTTVTGGSLTWNKRRAITTSQGYSQYELWWAVAPSALTAQAITVNWSANFDNAALVVFGVNGCSTTAPWDVSSSLPAQWISASNTTDTPAVSGINTINPHNFLIFGFGTSGNQATIGTIPAGFTQVDFGHNNGGTLFAANGVAYQAVSATLTNQSYSWGSTIAATKGALGFFDALTADAPPATQNSTLDLKTAGYTGHLLADSTLGGVGGVGFRNQANTAWLLEVLENGSLVFADGSSQNTVLRGNRNLIVDGNFEQWMVASVAITPSAAYVGPIMYVVSAGAGGAGTVARGSLIGTPVGWTAPVGSFLTWTQSTASTGTVAGNNTPMIWQNIESSRSLSGRSATFSCNMWVSSGSITIPAIMCRQSFGSGGSPSAAVLADKTVNWVVGTQSKKFSVRLDVPDISGKTLGTNNNDCLIVGMLLPPGVTFTLAMGQWQTEESSPSSSSDTTGIGGAPTPYEYRGPQVEYARMQRYYETGQGFFQAANNSTTANLYYGTSIPFKVTKRVVPQVSASNISYNQSSGLALTPFMDAIDFNYIGNANAQNVTTFNWVADARL